MARELNSIERAGIHLTFNLSLIIIVLTSLGLIFYEMINPVSVTKNELLVFLGFGALGIMSVLFKNWSVNRN